MSETLQHALIGVAGAINLAILVGVVWVGWASLKSRTSEKAREELEKLAQVRGDHIETLESRIGILEAEVHSLRGEVRALREFKADDIADKVVAKLVPCIEELLPSS